MGRSGERNGRKEREVEEKKRRREEEKLIELSRKQESVSPRPC